MNAAARHEMVAKSQPKFQFRWHPPVRLHCYGEHLNMHEALVASIAVLVHQDMLAFTNQHRKQKLHAR